MESDEPDPDAYVNGRWCYANNEDCPYRTTDRRAAWRRGYIDAHADHAREAPCSRELTPA